MGYADAICSRMNGLRSTGCDFTRQLSVPNYKQSIDDVTYKFEDFLYLEPLTGMGKLSEIDIKASKSTASGCWLGFTSSEHRTNCCLANSLRTGTCPDAGLGQTCEMLSPTATIFRNCNF